MMNLGVTIIDAPGHHSRTSYIKRDYTNSDTSKNIII